MQQHEIQHFLESYFSENNCTIISNTTGKLVVKLTPALDKMLMNRPFYWHYIEKTGGTPEPATLTLLTKKLKNETGEFIHVGSPRLHQIINTAKEGSRFLRMYEDVRVENDAPYIPLNPWLNLTMKVSFLCDRKRDMLYSLGLDLITGQIYEHFFSKVAQRTLTPKLPDYCFPLTPLIKPQSGINRLKNHLLMKIKKTDHQWAIDANKRWQADLDLLERFYEDQEKTDVYANEKEALKIQYEPKINIEVISGGIFHLKNG